MIGVPRSGTSVLSEAISLHERLGWLSNYLNKFPGLPLLAVLNRLTEIFAGELSLRGRKKQQKGIASSIRKYLPYSAEAFPMWKRCCGEKFPVDYLIGHRATEMERARILKYVRNVLSLHGKGVFFAKLTGPDGVFKQHFS